MSFGIAISGLSAAQADLDVTSNNIANSESIGFKQSRTEFAELFSRTLDGTSTIQSGNGVRIADVSQQFTQGSIMNTGNALDLAMNGTGFFAVNDNGATKYTRAGAFSTDKDGYVVNSSSQRLQVYPPILDTSDFNTSQLTDLRLQNNQSSPSATTAAECIFNLPANVTAPTVTPFDTTDAATYNKSTSLTIYDSLGAAHTATMYFVKQDNSVTATAGGGNTGTVTFGKGVPVDSTAVGFAAAATIAFPSATTYTIDGGAAQAYTSGDSISVHGWSVTPSGIPVAGDSFTVGPPASDDNTWAVHLAVDGTAVSTVETLQYDTSGALTTPSSGTLDFNTWNASTDAVSTTGGIDPGTGAALMGMNFDLSQTTQYGSSFLVASVTQDGYTTGQLSGITVDGNGVVSANYTNGQYEHLGQIAVVNFNNAGGLQKLDGTEWGESPDSGHAQLGTAGNLGLGVIQSGSLEASNVDITKQLVNMIVAQRNYQSNAQVISTEKQMTQVVLDMAR